VAEYQCLCAEGMPERCPCTVIRWAEMYGQPEEWAKTAQQLYTENERLRDTLGRIAEPAGIVTVDDLCEIAQTALSLEQPAPTRLGELHDEIARLRAALLAAVPLADVPGTPNVVAAKLRGIARGVLSGGA